MNTVKIITKYYTYHKVRRPQADCRLVVIIGRLSQLQWRHLLGKTYISSCDLSKQDGLGAHRTVGPDVWAIKEKTVRRKEPLVNPIVKPIHDNILQKHRKFKECFDVMHVKGIAFFVSIAYADRFCTEEALENRRTEMLLRVIDSIRMTYIRRGFLMNRAA